MIIKARMQVLATITVSAKFRPAKKKLASSGVSLSVTEVFSEGTVPFDFFSYTDSDGVQSPQVK